MPSPGITATRYVLGISSSFSTMSLRAGKTGAAISGRTWSQRDCFVAALLAMPTPLFIHVPDVGVEQPLVGHLSPDDGVFQGAVLRRRALRLEGAGADLARAAAADRHDVGCGAFDVAELLHRLVPEFLDVGAAVHDRCAGRQHIAVVAVHRGARGGVALVERRPPLILEALDRRLALRHRRSGAAD